MNIQLTQATAPHDSGSRSEDPAVKTHKANSEDPVLQVISEFSAVFTFVRTRWQEHATDLHPEMSRAMVPTLLTIMRHGPVTATQLTEMLRSEKSVVSKQVALLKKFGLVATEQSQRDGRLIDLTVTPLGQERIEYVRTRLADHYRERFEGWSESDITALRDALHRFNLGNEPQ